MDDVVIIAKGLTKVRTAGLLSYPSTGQYFRATVHMRWATFNWLRQQGLTEGETQRSRLTPLGHAVRDYLVNPTIPKTDTEAA